VTSAVLQIMEYHGHFPRKNHRYASNLPWQIPRRCANPVQPLSSIGRTVSPTFLSTQISQFKFRKHGEIDQCELTEILGK
jgi:hypothetical protein